MADITLTHRTPVLQLCRALIEADQPDQPMTVVDAATGRAGTTADTLMAGFSGSRSSG
jgi:hypothetical protein